MTPPRPRKPENAHLPPGVREKHGAYYVVVAGVWHWLCRMEEGEPEMLRCLGNFKEQGTGKLAGMFDHYEKNVLPTLAEATIQDYRPKIRKLREAFGHLNTITPSDVADMQDLLALKSPYVANRHVAVLSSICKAGIRKRYLVTNPCRDIARVKGEKARKHMVTHDMYWAAWDLASDSLRCAMDLAYYTGQQQKDIIGLTTRQLKSDGIHFERSKTGKEGLVKWSPELREVVDRALALPRGDVVTLNVVVTQKTKTPYTSSGIQTEWQRLKKLLPESCHFQFKDIRAKSARDHKTGEHLLHADKRVLDKHYKNNVQSFEPAPKMDRVSDRLVTVTGVKK